MSEWSRELLEFEALRELLRRYLSSAPAFHLLDQLAPIVEPARLEEMLALTGEAVSYLKEASRPKSTASGSAIRLRFRDLPDPSNSVAKLRIEGSCLDPIEILQLVVWLEKASEAHSVLGIAGRNYPRLAALGASICDFRPLLRRLSGKILPDGSVADDASPYLARVRRDIERQKKLIQTSLERFLRQHRDDHVLQEDFVTIRNERFVVPIVAGQQSRIDGVIHGSSGSGHTLFVEPLETIQLNNELVSLTERELAEVHRILLELTNQLREHCDGVREAISVLGELEFHFGLADFAVDFDAIMPLFSDEGNRRLHLKRARHPLLLDVLRRQRRPVVPLSLTLTQGERTLLISGPNTGGKTVALKTIGLLALMAHCGLPVPAEEAEFPRFDQILADIGDNQSIQESLSTFSAHMTRVRDVIQCATPDSLILLDELGRATDPEEGGALAVAVVSSLHEIRAFTVASTHLMAVKTYGATTQGVINGSMGFNEESLDPTFVLSLGAPGKSAGIDIASRLGIPAFLIARARDRMSTRDRDMLQFLNELHVRLEETEKLRRDLMLERANLSEREHQLAAESQRREREKLREIEERFSAAMAGFESRSAEAIRRLTETVERRKASEQAQRAVSKARRELRESFEAEISTLRESPQSSAVPSSLSLQEGTRIRIKDIREPALIRRIRSDGLLEVAAGFLRLQVPREDVLEVLPDTGKPPRVRHNISVEQSARDVRTLREINVIGQTAEEATNAVERFLDDAALAGVVMVRIVHGHGMGILRRRVASILENHPQVDRFYAAPQHEGGSGATIAELREIE